MENNLEQKLTQLLQYIDVSLIDYEIIIVDNLHNALERQTLHQILENEYAVTILQIADNCEELKAINLGVAQAIGDYILVLNPLNEPNGVFDKLIANCISGAEVVLVREDATQQTPMRKILSRTYHRLLKEGLPPHSTLPNLLCINRAVALYVKKNINKNIRLNELSLHGFHTVTVSYDPSNRGRSKRHIASEISRGLTTLIEFSNKPRILIRLLLVISIIVSAALLVGTAYIWQFSSQTQWLVAVTQSIVLFCFALLLACVSEYLFRVHGVKSSVNKPRIESIKQSENMLHDDLLNVKTLRNNLTGSTKRSNNYENAEETT